jgi:protoheme ferro-lyase
VRVRRQLELVAAGVGDLREQALVVARLAAAVGEHVLHHRAQLPIADRDPRAVGGEHSTGGDLGEVAEHLARAGRADRAVGVDLERGVAEERLVGRLELVQRIAAARDDRVADRQPLVVRAARRVVEVGDLALVVGAGLVAGGGDGRADDQEVAVDVGEGSHGSRTVLDLGGSIRARSRHRHAAPRPARRGATATPRAPCYTAAVAHGLLLINLGTPRRSDPTAVRRYLREFLGDPRVLDMNAVGRFLLLNLIILPTRPARARARVPAIWDATRGSPLLYHGEDLRRRWRRRLGDDWQVELGMRYGNAVDRQRARRLIAAGVDRVVALPLFPHTASSSSGSALAELYRIAGARTTVPRLAAVPAFHDDDGFLDAEAAVAAPILAAHRPEHVLFSFHGLPERHVRAADPSGARCLAARAAATASTLATATATAPRASRPPAR